MEGTGPPLPAKNGLRRWLRVLRPLGWWLLLVLLLYGIRTHQRLGEETFISFTVNLDGNPARYEGTVMLDGRPVSTGERVSIGRHRFEVMHPKAEPFSTNLFIWYGERKLGDIKLERTRGVLALNVEPPATKLSVSGDEFTTTLTKSAGITSSIPTDVYRIEARWANHEQTERVNIWTKSTTPLRLSPSLGALMLESDPPGATVLGNNGHTIGMTPLTLREMHSGAWKGELRLDGHIPVVLALTVAANQTNIVHTNLVNWGYAQAMESARQYFRSQDYDRALESLTAALRFKPNDPDATALQKETTVSRYLQRATALAVQGDYSLARQEVESALGIERENSKAKAMLADFEGRQGELLAAQERKRAEEILAKERQERLNRPKMFLQTVCQRYLDADLFGTHTISSSKPVKELSLAVVNALTNGSPVFQIIRNEWPHPEVFTIEAKQGMFGGYRQCVIVGGQIKDDETAVLFKVLEYETHLNVNLGGILRLSDGKPAVAAIHPNRMPQMTLYQQTRFKEGVQLVTQRVQQALGGSGSHGR